MLTFLGNASVTAGLSVRLLGDGQPGSWFIMEPAAASGFSSRSIPITAAAGNQKPVRLRIAGSSSGNIQYLRGDTSGQTVSGSAFPIALEFSTDGVLNISHHCLSLGTTTLRESDYANWVVERVRSCNTASSSIAETEVQSDSSDSEDDEDDKKLMGCDVVRLHQRFSNSYLCGKAHHKNGKSSSYQGSVYFVPGDHCDSSNGLHTILPSIWTVLQCHSGTSLENCGEEISMGGSVMIQVASILAICCRDVPCQSFF
jgi:hypothetical protein